MSQTIDGLGTLYTDYYNTESTTTKKVQTTLDADYSTATEEELMDACKEFETYFTEQMFKALQKMVPESEESSSSGYDSFKDMLVQEYAQNNTETGSLGIAQMLFEQMKRNYDL